jgi:cytochrome c556
MQVVSLITVCLACPDVQQPDEACDAVDVPLPCEESFMKRLVILTMLVVSATLTTQAVEAQNDNAPQTRDIMGKVGKPTGLFNNVARELKEADPMWDEVQQQTREMTQLLALLGKAAPPKGDKDSWARRTREFADNAKVLEKAATKMDLKAAREVSKKMGDSCKGCHDVHRPK